MRSSPEPTGWQPTPFDAADARRLSFARDAASDPTALEADFARLDPEAGFAPGPADRFDRRWAPVELRGVTISGSGAATPVGTVAEIDRAYDRGHEDGARLGAARAESRLGPAIEALTRVTHALDASRAEFERDRERDLLGLALAVARKILMREVTTDPKVIANLVARALELLPLDRSIEVRLHPEDLAAIGSGIETLAPPGLAPMIEWLPEASLERGSFVVETPMRVVDGRSDAALRTLYERLENE